MTSKQLHKAIESLVPVIKALDTDSVDRDYIIRLHLLGKLYNKIDTVLSKAKQRVLKAKLSGNKKQFTSNDESAYFKVLTANKDSRNFPLFNIPEKIQAKYKKNNYKDILKIATTPAVKL